MTDAEPDEADKSKARERDLQIRVRGLMERLDTIDRHLFTLRQVGLLEECQGLLAAVGNGLDVREGPRIRECLLEMISLFGDRGTTLGELAPEKRKAVSEIGIILRGVTAAGVALEPTPDRLRRYSVPRSTN